MSSVFGRGFSQDACVMPDSQRTQADVEVGKGDPEQTHPRPERVAVIQTTDAAVGLPAKRRFREPVDASALRSLSNLAKAVSNES